jgi:hypothetical protein
MLLLMALTGQNVPTPTSVAKPYIAPGASEVTTPDEEGQGETCYAIVELDANGTPVRYLAFLGEGWEPGMPYWLTTDRALAWRFGTRQSAQDTADVINSTPGNSPTLHVIEIDCDGPPLNLPPPATLQ